MSSCQSLVTIPEGTVGRPKAPDAGVRGETEGVPLPSRAYIGQMLRDSDALDWLGEHGVERPEWPARGARLSHEFAACRVLWGAIAIHRAAS
jgi:hypothetical protein